MCPASDEVELIDCASGAPSFFIGLVTGVLCGICGVVSSQCTSSGTTVSEVAESPKPAPSS